MMAIVKKKIRNLTTKRDHEKEKKEKKKKKQQRGEWANGQVPRADFLTEAFPYCMSLSL